ncbi:unnamed protein product [Citrullus colocynthis]|uniref:Uncharacterized protein n=1 Tax=Citrullus colocynthis TaxID=252529 RepID=A0ABP0Y9H9_9ROSI
MSPRGDYFHEDETSRVHGGLKEIASGLETAGKNFIWVVRKLKEEEEEEEGDWLPEGFEQRGGRKRDDHKRMGAAGFDIGSSNGGWICDTLWVEFHVGRSCCRRSDGDVASGGGAVLQRETGDGGVENWSWC